MRINKSVFVRYSWLLMIAFIGWSCSGNKDNKVPEHAASVAIPRFSGDSAFNFVKKQVSFGPRIPNSKAHRLAGDYLTSQLKAYGAIITVQNFEATTFDGQRISLRNIVASFYPAESKRILLASHWDTRPYSDKDPEKPFATFEGANDGASGVAVLLEIARQLHSNPSPSVGIDMIFFDGEDWGERDDTPNRMATPDGLESWWCLGSQYWARHKHKPSYSAYFGILLDMVGARNAHFFQEGASLEYAPRIVDKVWSTAARLGYSSTFVRQKEAPIIDDHAFVNELAKIPMIDIVHYDPLKGYFGDFHHTQRDSLAEIDPATLSIVGAVVLNVIYSEE